LSWQGFALRAGSSQQAHQNNGNASLGAQQQAACCLNTSLINGMI